MFVRGISRVKKAQPVGMGEGGKQVEGGFQVGRRRQVLLR